MKYKLMLVGCAAFWGLAFPVMRMIGESIDSLSFLAVRFTLATLLLVLIFLPKLKEIKPSMLLPCFGVGHLMALHSFLQVEGLHYTSSANSSFITSTNVIFVPIFMYLFFRQKPTKNIIIGLISIVIGFFFISGMVSLSPFGIQKFTFNFGDFLTLLCAIFTALYMIVFNKLAVKYDESLVNLLHMGGAAVGMWVLCLIKGSISIDITDSSAVVGILYCGMFASALGFWLLSKAQAKLDASTVAVLCSLEPIFATVFAALIWREPITVVTALGGAFILYGVIKSTR